MHQKMAKTTKKDTYRILSIDGGGTRGILPAVLLDCIYKDFGKEPSDLFDMYAGTSTGGIICLGLAAGLKTEKLVDLYLNESKNIFHETFFDRLTGLDEHLRANYQHRKFKKILDDIFGTKTLGDVHKDAEFGAKGKEVMVCSFDLSPEREADRNCNYRPVIYHSSFIRDQQETLVDLALRTSAGPTYFPVYQKKYVDGGIAINNPAMAAVAYAVNDSEAKGEDKGKYLENGYKGLQKDLKALRVFSLSTGTSNLNRIEESKVGAGNWGNIQWIKYLPELLTESNVQSTIYYVKNMLGNDRLLRLDPDFNDKELAHKSLWGRSIPMDTTDPEVLNHMKDFAEKLYQKEKKTIVKFLGIESA